MDCHSYNELIHIYLDGDATPEQKAELYAHMDMCPECKTHVNELKKSHCLYSKLVSHRSAVSFYDKCHGQFT